MQFFQIPIRTNKNKNRKTEKKNRKILSGKISVRKFDTVDSF